MAAAATRGSRETKNTCASVLSANGMERSKTRVRLMEVLPTSGASTATSIVSAPNAMIVTATRRRTSVGSGKRHHRQMSCARVKRDVRIDAVKLTDVRRRQHVPRRSCREDAARFHEHQLGAQ